MADNSGQYIPNTVDYVRIKERLHGIFGKAVDFAYSRFGRAGVKPAPLPEPQQGPTAANPPRALGPAFGNEAKRRFLYTTMLVFLSTMSVRAEVITLFSPVDNVEKAIVIELDKATMSIHCALFGITNSTLTASLLRAVDRGVDVKLALDKMQSAGQASTHVALAAGGATVAIKKLSALNHNKYCVMDFKTVVMGSWNWSGNAQRQDNSEVIIRKNPGVALRFVKDFGRIWVRDSDAR